MGPCTRSIGEVRGGVSLFCEVSESPRSEICGHGRLLRSCWDVRGPCRAGGIWITCSFNSKWLLLDFLFSFFRLIYLLDPDINDHLPLLVIETSIYVFYVV